MVGGLATSAAVAFILLFFPCTIADSNQFEGASGVPSKAPLTHESSLRHWRNARSVPPFPLPLFLLTPSLPPPMPGTLIAINSNQQRPSSPHRTQYFLDVGGRVYRLEDPRGVLPGLPPAGRVMVKASDGPSGTNTLVVKKARAAVAALMSPGGGAASPQGGSGSPASLTAEAPMPTPGASPLPSASTSSDGGEAASTTVFQPVGVLEGDMIAVGPGNVVWTGGSSLVHDLVLAVQGLSSEDGEGPETADGVTAPGEGGSSSGEGASTIPSPPPDSETVIAGASQAPQGAAVYSGTPPRVVADMRTLFYIIDFCGMGGGPVATVQVGGEGRGDRGGHSSS